MSDFLGNRIGMRGRLWWLFFCQMTGSVMCVLLGIGAVQSNLANTIGVICVFSFFIEAACGATYGVYPFVSHRALGRYSIPLVLGSMPCMFNAAHVLWCFFCIAPQTRQQHVIITVWSCRLSAGGSSCMIVLPINNKAYELLILIIKRSACQAVDLQTACCCCVLASL